MSVEESIEAFRELGSSFIADGLQTLGLPRRTADPGLRPLLPDKRIAGSVATMRLELRPTKQPYIAYEIARMFEQAKCVTSPVAVMESRLGLRAIFGGGSCRSHLHAGFTGAICEGAMRDVAEVRALGMQTFYRVLTPDSFASPMLPEGYVACEANVEVCIGGVVVAPGDLVVADEDGIVFCRPEDAPAVIAAAQEILVEEESIFKRWDEGQGFLEGLKALEQRMKKEGLTL